MSESRQELNLLQKRKPLELTREVLDLFSYDIEHWIKLFKENISILKKAPECLTRILIALAKKWKTEEVIEILRDLEIMAIVSNSRYFYKLCLELLWFYKTKKKKYKEEKVPKENIDFILEQILWRENIIGLLWLKILLKILRSIYINWWEKEILRVLKEKIIEIFCDPEIELLRRKWYLWFLSKFRYDYLDMIIINFLLKTEIVLLFL